MGRLFRFVFGRPLATAEREKQKVGPLQGVPILARLSQFRNPRKWLILSPRYGANGLRLSPQIENRRICC